ncbi:MAG TPA: thioredoxin domain-containing protein [Lentisphaeria bacterium]|nr:MAG: hypothetical protein A2X48_24295 [Lentisphaerae bacterium GWF2_49_21]HBC86859.1 thioredoxin domain-containing protein [Lentisphaeria bacterium]
MNSLSAQKSPYLLQHARNPVDWFPWGEEAFRKAGEENKPIFLSIGYSTCHWCHVMEKESFEDEQLAAILNKSFISIKVDREERPDVDNVYMTVCQALTGTGGWPLTIIMTPDKKPFFAATYVPKDSRFGMTGLTEILQKIDDLWRNKNSDILLSAGRVSSTLENNSGKTFNAEPEKDLSEKSADDIAMDFDKVCGGYGNAPKFPSAHRLIFLLRYWKASGDKEILKQVEFTLGKMRAGGICDQVGGGFHRYSTDRKWLVPHFEKMLYDQAMLAMAYTEAAQATGNTEYSDTARDVIGYVLRDMTSLEGAFYSAEDADSEGEEGKFYLWTYKEIFSVLPKDDALVAIRYFNIDDEGNFTDPIQGNSNKNILHVKKTVEEIAGEFDKTPEEIKTIVSSISARLLEHRAKRVRPLRDTKILADWNGLMIAAIAKFAGAFNSGKHLKIAEKAADFVLGKMRAKNGDLFHRFADGELAVEGQLDDYAFMILGLLELYEAGFDEKYMAAAIELDKILKEKFLDQSTGSYFMTPDNHEKLVFRPKVYFDGALPSGNSVQMLNLLRLSELTGNTAYEETAYKVLKSVAELINGHPGSFTNYLSAVLHSENSSEIIICGDARKEIDRFFDGLRMRYMPFNTLISITANDYNGFAGDYRMLDGKTTFYVCRKRKCSRPVTDIEEALKLIR